MTKNSHHWLYPPALVQSDQSGAASGPRRGVRASTLGLSTRRLLSRDERGFHSEELVHQGRQQIRRGLGRAVPMSCSSASIGSQIAQLVFSSQAEAPVLPCSVLIPTLPPLR